MILGMWISSDFKKKTELCWGAMTAEESFPYSRLPVAAVSWQHDLVAECV